MPGLPPSPFGLPPGPIVGPPRAFRTWISVPNVVGLERAPAETQLDSDLLRHIARFRPAGSGIGGGLATAQSPATGTTVGRYSIVTVTYLSNLEPLPPDSPVDGPAISGTFDGQIKGVKVDRTGATIAIQATAQIGRATLDVGYELSLYDDQPVPLVPRAEWMRRGAMLSLAQRAFTSGARTRVIATNLLVESIELYNF
jgi:hypothetical protein